jgi:hypothetical protein
MEQCDFLMISDHCLSNNKPARKMNGVVHRPVDVILSGATMALRNGSSNVTTCRPTIVAASTGDRRSRQQQLQLESALGQRRVVPTDSILHIRSLDSHSPASVRNIRAALLQIRDSLSQPTVASARNLPAAKAVTRLGDRERVPADTGARCERSEITDDDEKEKVDGLSASTNSATSPCHVNVSNVEVPRQACWPVRCRHRRPDRLSLPTPFYGRYKTSLTSDGDEDEEAVSVRAIRRRSAARRRTSVKFADEFGLNLNTFVMIPPRSRIGARDSITSAIFAAANAASAVAAGRSSEAMAAGASFTPLSYLMVNDNGTPVGQATTAASGKPEGFYLRQPPSSDGEQIPRSAPAENDGADRTDPQSTEAPSAVDVVVAQSTSEAVDETQGDELASSSSAETLAQTAVGPQFRLCFDQPFADQQKFKTRLAAQMVCLENVRVEDWSPGGSGPSSASSSTSSPPSVGSSSPPILVAANSVMLCTIRVRNLHPEKRVFARCTDNDWRTFADLPAHHVGGIDSLGYEHDRFCFAVRRPTQASYSDGPETWNDCKNGGGGGSAPETASMLRVAVEFAVCFQAGGKVYWDNNCGANYRIEWF